MIRTLDLVFQNNACAIASYLLEGKTGLILIETGPHSTLPQLKKAIEEQGFKIEDVKNVLLTHIHLDHAGAAWTFAKQGATIYLHPFGVRHMADPSKLMESAKRIYRDKMDELWGEMHPIPEAQMITAAHEEKVEVDGLTFTAYHTPGHASHHIAWEIDKVVFTGDVAGVQIGNGPVIAPLPPPDIDIEQWKESIQLLRDIKPKAMYLTHYGAVIDVEHHLDQLEDNIENLSKWVKTHLEAGESIEEMTPLFDEYCVEQLKELEMTSVEIEQYQAANPAWMSVAGLTRYWQKKNK